MSDVLIYMLSAGTATLQIRMCYICLLVFTEAAAYNPFLKEEKWPLLVVFNHIKYSNSGTWVCFTLNIWKASKTEINWSAFKNKNKNRAFFWIYTTTPRSHSKPDFPAPFFQRLDVLSASSVVRKISCKTHKLHHKVKQQIFYSSKLKQKHLE